MISYDFNRNTEFVSVARPWSWTAGRFFLPFPFMLQGQLAKNALRHGKKNKSIHEMCRGGTTKQPHTYPGEVKKIVENVDEASRPHSHSLPLPPRANFVVACQAWCWRQVSGREEVEPRLMQYSVLPRGSYPTLTRLTPMNLQVEVSL